MQSTTQTPHQATREEIAFTFLLTMPGVTGLASKEGEYERTEVRTPMQWNNTANAGFSTAALEQLYLPVEIDLSGYTIMQKRENIHWRISARQEDEIILVAIISAGIYRI